MIGNRIEFVWLGDTVESIKARKHYTGLVVDAYTEVTGNIRGSGDVFLGFGESRVNGSTQSQRKYKVEFYHDWDVEKTCIQYKDIYDWQLIKIISFTGQSNQEVNEEKINLKPNKS